MVRNHDQIVAVGLLTQADLDRLGSGFRNAIPVDETPMFEELLRAIDEATSDAPRGQGARTGG